MILFARDAGEIDALVTDRYLDALLAGEADLSIAGEADIAAPGQRGQRRALDAAVRAASRRLATDLPRFHPSFRFEERLAARLAEAAAAMRLPIAAGSEADVVSIPMVPPELDPLAVLPDDDRADALSRPVLIGGAVAASALSLAGAAWLAWRRRGSASPMARAARAAHATRAAHPARRPLVPSGRA